MNIKIYTANRMKRILFIIVPILFSCGISDKNINQLIDGINIDNNVKHGLKNLVFLEMVVIHALKMQLMIYIYQKILYTLSLVNLKKNSISLQGRTLENIPMCI